MFLIILVISHYSTESTTQHKAPYIAKVSSLVSTSLLNHPWLDFEKERDEEGLGLQLCEGWGYTCETYSTANGP